MTARTASSPWTINDLHRGGIYRATTSAGDSIGEYLGLETAYGDRAMLLRNNDGTSSIYLDDVTSLQRLAA
ncbi:MAG: hypothetical protein HKN93_03045 [Acidimicrobiia bacterium]|nr:hypothetical protein [Acidimicrobiia bacterium]